MSNDNHDLEGSRVNLFLHAENVRIFDQPQDRQLPVTLVTGFLGAGKTTLLNHILTNQSNLRIAAAVNDFAELNIDENLIRHHNKNATTNAPTRVVELSNGCVCCHLLGDLQTAVWELLQEVDALDSVNYLVVETSGVSDPLRIIRTLDAKFGKCFRARLDSVVTVVDADQLLESGLLSAGSDSQFIAPPSYINNQSAMSRSQVAIAQLQYADVVVLNKMDLLPDRTVDGDLLEERIRKLNPHAAIHRTQHCRVPLSAILDVTIPEERTTGPTPITHERIDVPIYVSSTGGALRSGSSDVMKTNNQHTNQNHLQTDSFASVSISIPDRPLSLLKLQKLVCSPLVQQLARMKGVLWLQGFDNQRCILHLSGRGRLGFSLDGPWAGPPTSEMAFIGRSTDFPAKNIQYSFANCTADDGGGNGEAQQVSGSGGDKDVSYLQSLQQCPEFIICNDEGNTASNHPSVRPSHYYFRLTGSNSFGYTEEEITRDLRIDIDSMNVDLADAVNASVDQPKAFLTYRRNQQLQIVLCYVGLGEPANNFQVLLREAKQVLAYYFRNVTVCACGT